MQVSNGNALNCPQCNSDFLEKVTVMRVLNRISEVEGLLGIFDVGLNPSNYSGSGNNNNPNRTSNSDNPLRNSDNRSRISSDNPNRNRISRRESKN